MDAADRRRYTFTVPQRSERRAVSLRRNTSAYVSQLEYAMILIISLIAIGIVLLFVEVIIPGGIIGAFGIVLITAGIVLGFAESLALGVGLFTGAIVFGIFGFLAWVRYFPDSATGKKIFLDKDAGDWQGYDKGYVSLLGARGIARTDLRPSGTALLSNKRYDVVSRGELIDQGSEIEVIEVEGNRIVVAAASDGTQNQV